jgi:hypothetical protein
MDDSGNWSRTQVLNGVQSVTLGSWQAFDEFLDHGDIRVQDYIWRGQAQDWPLLPELYRNPDRYTACSYDAESEAIHLDNFKRAYRSLKSVPPEPLDDDSWWALGRHYGLATPLLDWTESPLYAAFFAFIEEDGCCDHARIVYALDRRSTELAAKMLGASDKRPVSGTGGMAHIVNPPRNNNPRLTAQAGLFTYLPVNFNIEVWLKAWQADAIGRALLLKIRIPDNERFDFLEQLEAKGVSSLTLYPDPHGAAEYCNLQALARGRHRLRPARLTPANLGG